MTIRTRIVTRGEKTQFRRLQKLSKKIRNPSKANRQVAIWLMRWVNNNFKNEGQLVGGWAPFKRGGRIVPGGIDTSAKLLQKTGRLRASFKPFWSAKTAGVGSDVKYAEYHEFGVPMNNLPERRMLPQINDTGVAPAIVKIYEAYIRRSAR